jgi:hypothetical protein
MDIRLDGYYLINGVWTLNTSIPLLTNKVYGVLDQPVSPMSPAWTTMLDYSCDWARGETTKDGAANKLTDELYDRGEYNGGSTAYTRYPPDPNSGEYFYLKAFLEDQRFPWGQCNDFANFLVCLVTSVGSHQFAAQRSHPLGLGRWFSTNNIDPAGNLPPGTVNWNYHQFAIFEDQGTWKVWDGCLSFASPTQPSGVPKALGRDTTYYGGQMNQGLVRQYGDGNWQPTPHPSGFIPEVYTGTPP